MPQPLGLIIIHIFTHIFGLCSPRPFLGERGWPKRGEGESSTLSSLKSFGIAAIVWIAIVGCRGNFVDVTSLGSDPVKPCKLFSRGNAGGDTLRRLKTFWTFVYEHSRSWYFQGRRSVCPMAEKAGSLFSRKVGLPKDAVFQSVFGSIKPKWAISADLQIVELKSVRNAFP